MQSSKKKEELIYDQPEHENFFEANLITLTLPNQKAGSLNDLIAYYKKQHDLKQIEQIIGYFFHDQYQKFIQSKDDKIRLECISYFAEAIILAFTNQTIYNAIKDEQFLNYLGRGLFRARPKQIKQFLGCAEQLLAQFYSCKQTLSQKQENTFVRIYLQIITMVEANFNKKSFYENKGFQSCILTFKTFTKIGLEYFRELTSDELLRVNGFILKLIKERHKFIPVKILSTIVFYFYKYMEKFDNIKVLAQHDVLNQTLMTIMPYRVVFYQLLSISLLFNQGQGRCISQYTDIFKKDFQRYKYTNKKVLLEVLSIWLVFHKASVFTVLKDVELVKEILKQLKNKDITDKVCLYMVIKVLIQPAVFLKPKDWQVEKILSKGSQITDFLLEGINEKDEDNAKGAARCLVAIQNLKYKKRAQGNRVYQNMRENLKKRGSLRRLFVKAKCLASNIEQNQLSCKCDKKDCLFHDCQSEDE